MPRSRAATLFAETAAHVESRTNGGTPEQAYAATASAAHRKALGQFFTPPNLAALMADWIGEIEPATILDPSYGTGILAAAALERCPSAAVIAFEKDPQILRYSGIIGDQRLKIRTEDYLYSSIRDHYDAVTMNPPYIRHREMDGYEDTRAEISLKSGFLIPKSANLYVYFTVRTALQLRSGGRAAVLIPTEWMNANFAGTFKRFLLETGLLREIVLFSGCSSIFTDALTTASILLLEKP
jgi:type I restriction-modification system DNA methylase subunit